MAKDGVMMVQQQVGVHDAHEWLALLLLGQQITKAKDVNMTRVHNLNGQDLPQELGTLLTKH